MPPRSSVLGLPPRIRRQLEQRLIANGFSGYRDLARSLQQRGYRISKGAVHRYGRQFEQRWCVQQMAHDQARALVRVADGDEFVATEALVRLLQQRLLTILIESEKPIDEFHLPSLIRAISNLNRTIMMQRRWVSAKQDRLDQLKRDGAGRLAALQAAGGLSPQAADLIRDLLIGLDPFSTFSPNFAPPPDEPAP